MKSVIFHATEAGAATTIRPLLAAFRRADFNILLDVSRDAARVLGESRHDDPASANIVICGYDKPSRDCTGAFLDLINQGVPTIGLLDSWRGIDRFWFPSGIKRRLPTKLAVPDELAKSYLIETGLPGSSIVPVGSTVLDEIRSLSSSARRQLKAQGRARIGIEINDPALVFFSEPLTNENGDLTSLLEAETIIGNRLRAAIKDKYGKEYRLICRRHPAEVTTHPSGWLDGNLLSEREILSVGNLVLGVGSTMMCHAVAAGCHVVCVDNWLKNWSPKRSEIPNTLWSSLRDGSYQNSNVTAEGRRHPPVGAVSKILNLATSLLQSSD